MRGEFIRAWSYMWPEVWQRIAKHPGAGEEICCEIYEAIEKLPGRLPPSQARPTVFRAPSDEEEDLRLRNDPEAAAKFFERLSGRHFKSEVEATRAIERVAEWLDEEYPAIVACRFRSIIKGFLKRHGLHYRLADAVSFRPSAAGILCGVVEQLEEMGDADQEFGELFRECEEAFGDLRGGVTEARVKSCIGKQMNVAEALARKHCQTKRIEVRYRDGNIADNPALSAMANVLDTWPHDEVKKSLRSYYAFTNSYPGIRHPGNRRDAIRPLGLRDAIAGFALTIGFASYLTDGFDHIRVYGV